MLLNQSPSSKRSSRRGAPCATEDVDFALEADSDDGTRQSGGMDIDALAAMLCEPSPDGNWWREDCVGDGIRLLKIAVRALRTPGPGGVWRVVRESTEFVWEFLAPHIKVDIPRPPRRSQYAIENPTTPPDQRDARYEELVRSYSEARHRETMKWFIPRWVTLLALRLPFVGALSADLD